MHRKDYYAIPDPSKTRFIFNLAHKKHIRMSKLNKQPHGGFESVNLLCEREKSTRVTFAMLSLGLLGSDMTQEKLPRREDEL